MKESVGFKKNNNISWEKLGNNKIVAVYIALALVLVINQVVFTVLLKNREMVQAAPPAFTMKIQALSGGNAKVLVQFTEAVTGIPGGHSSLDLGDFVVGGSDGLNCTLVNHITSTNMAILTMDGPIDVDALGQVTITCAPNSIYDDGGGNVCSQSPADLFNGVYTTTDVVAPTFSSWDLDMNAGTLALNFSEAMDFSFDFDETQLIIEDATSATTYTLTDSVGSWTAPATFTVTLSPTDINYLKFTPGLAENNSNLTINDITGFRDAVENIIVAGVASVPVAIYIADTTSPLVSAINLNTDFSGCASYPICNPGDAIIFTWDNSAGGDNPTGYNSDFNSVSALLNNFHGSEPQAMYDDGTNGDLMAGDGKWTYTLTVSTTDDYSDKLFHIQVADYDGNLSIPQCGLDIACGCANKVIADYTFSADLDCLTGVDGLIIDKDDITIDGSSNNYTLLGTYGSPGTDYFTGQHGIINIGHSNITIKNLIIRDFFYGILEGSAGAPLSNITITDSSLINSVKYEISFIFPVGIIIVNSDTNNFTGNIVTGYSRAIFFASATNNNISSNVVEANSSGIDVSNSSTANSTITGNIIKLTNETALKIEQIAGATVTISNNTFLFNRRDIENESDDVGVTYNYISNHYSHNIRNRMIHFAAEPVTNLQQGVDTANFVFEMRDAAGFACPGCTYNIETSPAEIVTVTPAGSTLSGSFVPSQYGIYTLQITITDSNGNIGKRNIPFYVFSVGGASDLATTDTTYYFRPQVDATHGQPKGSDARSLLLTAPTSIETESCSQWVINSIDELPPYPFGTITANDYNFWGKSALHSNAYLYRFWDDSVDRIQIDTIDQGSDYHYIGVTFSGLDWKMDYPYSWYHPVFEYGKIFETNNNPFIQSQVPPDPRFSTATITHTYTTTPAIKYFSDSDVLLLAANPSTSNPAHSTLVLDGTDAINRAVNVTIENYKYPFLSAKTRINSDGTATLMASNVTAKTTFESVNMDIIPAGGSVDVVIDTWHNSGDYYKKWTENSVTPPITVTHIVADLLPNTIYPFKVNGAFVSNIMADGSGEINFDYVIDSSKIFEVGSPAPISGGTRELGAPLAAIPPCLALDVQENNTPVKAIDWKFTDNSFDEIGFRLYDVSDQNNFILEVVGQNINVIQEKNLQTNTAYTRVVKAYNDAIISSATSPATCYTLANVPNKLSISKETADSITLKLDPSDGNPPDTKYAIKEINKLEYINGNGDFTAIPVWLTYEQWGGENGITVRGSKPAGVIAQIIQMVLSSNTEYSFGVMAENGDGIETGLSETASGSTSAPAPTNANVNVNQAPASGGEIPSVPPATNGNINQPPSINENINQSLEIPGITNTNVNQPPIAPAIEEEISEIPIISPILELFDDPMVEQASQNVLTPILISIAAVNTLPAVVILSFYLLPYLHLIFLEPLLLLFGKKRKKWGVVYNSLTKLPVDLALVRLYNKKTNQLVQTRVTDGQGRYIIIAKEPGKYYLSVTKPGFVSPSSYLRGETQDTKYIDLYHGEVIEVTAKDAVITANIPLDQAEKKVLAFAEIIRSFLLKNIRVIVSYVGIILAMIVVLIIPNAITIGCLMLHIIFFLAFRRFIVPAKPKSWGIVYDQKTNKPLGSSVVRIFDLKFNKLLETQVTDSKGRYSFLVGKNQYQMLAEKPGYQKKEIKPVDLVKNEDIVNLDIKLSKS